MRVQPMAVCALRDLSATLGGDFANNFALPRIVSFGRDSSVYRCPALPCCALPS